ncbi:hypothetical protein F5B18DRAFT_662596 [Nemania serpens]|nr:hypothetical protein F5B18DRAFT_662596 [Nemania serpens]
MRLEIVTHTMVSDIRPIMRHPLNPTSHIVDPFTAPRDTCCAHVASRPSERLRCPTNGCCHVTVRSFSCDCSSIVRYHRYTPSKTPSAYTVNTAKIPSRGVWRRLQTLDDISRAATQAQPALPEELQVARWGLHYAIAQLGPMAKELEAASRKKDLKEQNLKNGAPYEKQVQAAHTELERMASVAWDMQTAYYTWMRMAATFERLEEGKVSAMELSAQVLELRQVL